jgi:hypothetical protein
LGRRELLSATRVSLSDRPYPVDTAKAGQVMAPREGRVSLVAITNKAYHEPANDRSDGVGSHFVVAGSVVVASVAGRASAPSRPAHVGLVLSLAESSARLSPLGNSRSPRRPCFWLRFGLGVDAVAPTEAAFVPTSDKTLLTAASAFRMEPTRSAEPYIQRRREKTGGRDNEG